LDFSQPCIEPNGSHDFAGGSGGFVSLAFGGVVVFSIAAAFVFVELAVDFVEPLVRVLDFVPPDFVLLVPLVFDVTGVCAGGSAGACGSVGVGTPAVGFSSTF